MTGTPADASSSTSPASSTPTGAPVRTGLRDIVRAMAGPWGSGGDDKNDGKDPRPTPGITPPDRRNPWATPDPVRDPQGQRGASALEELLKRGRDGFGGGGGGTGSGGPGLPGSRRVWTLGIIGLVAAVIVASSVHVVPPESEGVITRLGSYSRTVGPGFKLTLPAPIERMQMEDVRAIRTLQIGTPNAADENFVLTRDQNIIDLAYEVRWSIRDPELYLFQIADQEGTIREVAESAMRAAVANFDLVQAIGPGRAQIESEVQQRMQTLLNQYRAGVSIQGIAIRQADPPQQVNEAFKQVTSARQERESNMNRARAYAQQVLERARGDASAFDAIYEQYRLAPDVTRRRLYYETMEQVLGTVDKTVVESGVTTYLPLRELRGRSAADAEAETSAAAAAAASATPSGGQ